MKAEQKSFSKQFETIDNLISQKQITSAKKQLKKFEKKIFDSWSCIGIYKRYIKINEKKLAENLLKKTIKKNHENNEIIALYSHFLINENRLDEAKKISENLRETKFASLYSQIILMESLRKIRELDLNKTNGLNNSSSLNSTFGLNADPRIKFFQNDDFYQIYLDAYKTSKNTFWIRNCAVQDILCGFYNRASDLVPVAFSDADDAFFWAQILYDAAKYDECVDSIQKSKKMFNDYQNKKIFKVNETKLIALESDSYMALSDMQNAEKVRKEISLENLDLNDENLPIILTNRAIWAKNNNLENEFADLLFTTVTNFKTFVPSLVLYSDFAFNSNLQKEEDIETLALRKGGFKSLSMEKYDNRRKIPLSDAIYRIDEALKIEQNPYLFIAKIDLNIKTQPNLSQKEKNYQIWNLLETTEELDGYNSQKTELLVQYALSYLLQTNQNEDAKQLFTSFVQKYDFYDEKIPFWNNFLENLTKFDLKLIEFASIFAIQEKKQNEAIRLLEYCVYESSGILRDGNIAQNVSTETCMNLGDVYFSVGNKDKSLELYGKIAGRETKQFLRSEIYYRIASIYFSLGDFNNALRSTQ